MQTPIGNPEKCLTLKNNTTPPLSAVNNLQTLEQQAAAYAAWIIETGRRTLYFYPLRRVEIANANKFRRLVLAKVTGAYDGAYMKSDKQWREILESRAQEAGFTIVEYDPVNR